MPTTLFCLGLRTSWAKKKMQNLALGPSRTSLEIDGNSVESVDSFVYLGSLRKSEDNSRQDRKRRISLVASVMSSFSRIWRDKVLHASSEYQDSPVPGPCDVRFVIRCRNLDITFV